MPELLKLTQLVQQSPEILQIRTPRLGYLYSRRHIVSVWTAGSLYKDVPCINLYGNVATL